MQTMLTMARPAENLFLDRGICSHSGKCYIRLTSEKGNLSQMPGCFRCFFATLALKRQPLLDDAMAQAGAPPCAGGLSDRPQLVEQIRMAVEQLEQLDQSQRRFGLVVLVAPFDKLRANGQSGHPWLGLSHPT